jgi:hypothetical protein
MGRRAEQLKLIEAYLQFTSFATVRLSDCPLATFRIVAA